MQGGRRDSVLGSADARLNYLTWLYTYLTSGQVGCRMRS